MIRCPELVIEGHGNPFKIDNANTEKDDRVVKADAIQVTHFASSVTNKMYFLVHHQLREGSKVYS